MMSLLQFSILIFLHIFASTCDDTFFPFRVLQNRNVQTYDELERVTLKYLCPTETTEDIQFMKDYRSYTYRASFCYLDKEFKDNEPKMCKKEPQPEYMYDEFLYCNPKDDVLSDRSTFRFSYLYCGSRENIKKSMEERILEIADRMESPMYHICWDKRTKKTIYTQHKIWSYGLFAEERLQKEQAYEPSIISTKQYFLWDSHFSQLEIAYKNQPVTPDRVTPRLMVPKEHMVFAAEKKATFHFINTAPLLEKLIPLMDLIDNRIKNFAIQENKLLTIYTTAFYVSVIGLPRYIGHDGKKFIIPNIWCKVVHYEVDENRHLGIAIIVINTLEFNANLSNAICEKPYECNFQQWIDARYTIPQGLEKHAFCCEVSKIIANFYPLDVEFNEVLPINTFNLLTLF